MQDAQGTTLLMRAAALGYGEVLRVLLAAHSKTQSSSRGARVNVVSVIDATNTKRQTALMLAAERDDGHRCVALLVQARASLDLRDSLGETALMKAARIGNVQSVRLLLAKGARGDIKDAAAATALLHAAYEGHRVTTLVLLARQPRITVAQVFNELGVSSLEMLLLGGDALNATADEDARARAARAGQTKPSLLQSTSSWLLAAQRRVALSAAKSPLVSAAADKAVGQAVRRALGALGLEQRGRAWWYGRTGGDAAGMDDEGVPNPKAGVSQRESAWTLQGMLRGLTRQPPSHTALKSASGPSPGVAGSGAGAGAGLVPHSIAGYGRLVDKSGQAAEGGREGREGREGRGKSKRRGDASLAEAKRLVARRWCVTDRN